MRQRKTFATLGALSAALVLAIGLGAGPARAASTVDVTYDLADTSINALFGFDNVLRYANERPLNGSVSGSMKVRYTSDSSSGMPIETGAVSLLSFNLQVQDNDPNRSLTLDLTGTVVTRPGYLTGTFNWQLTAPAAGNLTAGGALTGLSGNLVLTGYANCLSPTAYYCQKTYGLGTQTVALSYSNSGPFYLSGQTGTFAGTPRHTLTGSGPIAVGFNALYFGGGFFLKSFFQYPTIGNSIVGREILREADGHDPKVIPEPGTLLLLGSGAAGLGLLGHSRRRARRG